MDATKESVVAKEVTSAENGGGHHHVTATSVEPVSKMQEIAGEVSPEVSEELNSNAPSAENKADESRSPGEKSQRKSAPRIKNNVRKTRIDKMMSKAELARRANLSVLTIDRIEKGFGCRMDTKRKILEALGLSLADRVSVFGEEE